MTFLQIKHFIVLAQMGSFVKASKALFITQPALSRSIKAFEEELGQLLFDRVGRKIEITSFGLSALRQAQDLLTAHDELKTSAESSKTTNTGLYKLGLSSGPGALVSVPLLLETSKSLPKLRLEISRANTSTLIDLLKDRQLDALVVDMRSISPDPELLVEQVCDIEGAFLCRRNHPLLNLKKINYDHLMQYSIASTPLSNELAHLLVQRYGDKAHIKQMVRLSSDEITDLVQVAKASDTVLLAAKAVGKELETLKIIPALNASAKYAFVSLRRRSNAVYHLQIKKMVFSIFEKLK